MGLNTTLTVLDLSKNPLGDEGAIAMAQCLTVNSKLKSLALNDSKIESVGTS